MSSHLKSRAGWKWYGFAGHHICGGRCQFHLTTAIGQGVLVSTVGRFVPDPLREPNKTETVGGDRLYETLVFAIDGEDGDGNPKFLDPIMDTIDSDFYQDSLEAECGHYAMCEKWATLTESQVGEQAAPPAAPAGLQLVPKVPTTEMVKRGLERLFDRPRSTWEDCIEAMYAEMLSVASQAEVAPASTLTGCNCRWKGETQVQWCEHHRAHLDAIHEWAQRTKAAEAKLNDQSATHWTEQTPVSLADHRQGRAYVAGPMTGLPEFNFPAFNAAAAQLRARGLTVLNPAEHGIVEGAQWGDYLRHDIAGLVSCERTHLLPGWQTSKGANLEVLNSLVLGNAITLEPGAEPVKPAAVLEFLGKLFDLDMIDLNGSLK